MDSTILESSTINATTNKISNETNLREGYQKSRISEWIRQEPEKIEEEDDRKINYYGTVLFLILLFGGLAWYNWDSLQEGYIACKTWFESKWPDWTSGSNSNNNSSNITKTTSISDNQSSNRNMSKDLSLRMKELKDQAIAAIARGETRELPDPTKILDTKIEIDTKGIYQLVIRYREVNMIENNKQ